jgi:YHS domain-containing protein
MTGWIIRFILVMLVVRAIWRLLAGVVEGAMGPAATRQGPRKREEPVPLVRDPVCGTYVPRARALTSGTGDAIQYFCSERCRAEYRSGRAR